jgi:serine protease AprX
LNTQSWPDVTRISSLWGTPGSWTAPTIAVVDSGVDSRLPDFRSRVLAQVDFTGSAKNAANADGYGHGTFVAALAAGAGRGRVGASPASPIVSLDVLDDEGNGTVGRVVEAANWILRNKDRYRIRVANFSLMSAAPGSVFFDPIDRAVEKLWAAGIVVVASSGNYGSAAGPSGVLYAPANDPFVITVGAADTGSTVSTADDTTAPWSSWGSTLDGFAKPELVAPGRYLESAMPANSTMARQHRERMVGPDQMRLSGTSFAAPIVAGAAAQVLGAHPDWTPSQVKGALMLTAQQGSFTPLSAGVGELDALGAAQVTSPPNPNAALERFLVRDPNGGPVPIFDAASWATAAAADASWATASWATASWATASWATASWATASWATASWATGSWATAAGADASWATASWATASWATGTFVD